MEKIKQLEKEIMRLDLPHFFTGDTVKVHVKHVLKKLNLRSRVEAAVWALKTTDLDQEK